MIREQMQSDVADRATAKAAAKVARDADKLVEKAAIASRPRKVAAPPKLNKPKVKFAEMDAGKRPATPAERRVFEARFRLPAGGSDPYRLYSYGPADVPGDLVFLTDVFDGKGAVLGSWNLDSPSEIGRNGLILPALTDAQLEDYMTPIMSPATWIEAMGMSALGLVVVGRTNNSLASKRHYSAWRTANGFRRREWGEFSIEQYRRSCRPDAMFSPRAAWYLIRDILGRLYESAESKGKVSS